jgi:hypothetical protein
MKESVPIFQLNILINIFIKKKNKLVSEKELRDIEVENT